MSVSSYWLLAVFVISVQRCITQLIDFKWQTNERKTKVRLSYSSRKATHVRRTSSKSHTRRDIKKKTRNDASEMICLPFRTSQVRASTTVNSRVSVNRRRERNTRLKLCIHSRIVAVDGRFSREHAVRFVAVCEPFAHFEHLGRRRSVEPAENAHRISERIENSP